MNKFKTSNTFYVKNFKQFLSLASVIKTVWIMIYEKNRSY
ncbi:hypothetical protein GM553_01985 [Commensalibacter sp. ESL0390]|nr:hypothetical protein [Commensalibacter melissae]